MRWRKWPQRWVFAAILLTPMAHAYQYVPTHEVWTTWPSVCRVKYPEMRVAQGGEFAQFRNPQASSRWQRVLGEETWSHLHHYCAGLGYMLMAEREFDDAKQRDFYWQRAIDELYYSFRHDDLTSVIAPKIVAALGRSLPKVGKSDVAKRHLQELISVQPKSVEAYATLATILEKEGNLSGAIELLEDARSYQDQPSAELSYMLGLYYLDAGRYEQARESATVAYRLGYPLPGLKNRLARAGHW